MEENRKNELRNLAMQRVRVALSYLNDDSLNTQLKGFSGKDEAEIPGYEAKPMQFGVFENAEFVVLMTDIRKSTAIINSLNGTRDMFVIFYSYAAVVANVLDKYKGSATEFLGDGVLGLFDTSKRNNNRNEALINAMTAAKEIMYVREFILNPIYQQLIYRTIDIGVGIDLGATIVTRFGYKTDNDLKAFGKCVYNVSRLCKGYNTIEVSNSAGNIWPSSPTGTLKLYPTQIKGLNGYFEDAYKVIA